MILFCCAFELGLPEDLSAIEVILYYYYYTIPHPSCILRSCHCFLGIRSVFSVVMQPGLLLFCCFAISWNYLSFPSLLPPRGRPSLHHIHHAMGPIQVQDLAPGVRRCRRWLHSTIRWSRCRHHTQNSVHRRRRHVGPDNRGSVLPDMQMDGYMRTTRHHSEPRESPLRERHGWVRRIRDNNNKHPA